MKVVSLVDDMDGKKAEKTLNFSFDGTDYEIDLSNANIQKFKKAIKPYMDKARRVGATSRRNTRRTNRRSSGSTTSKSKLIREWATENGLEVSPRGRIPAEIVEQYDAATK